MTHVWVDASAGVAGDMLLGALLDAGADLAVVQRAVDAVVADSVRIGVTEVTRAGIRATKAEVHVLVQDQPHRRWSRIAQMLAEADLDSGVRDRAAAVFSRLADAESRAHGIPAEDVHFHEVGGLDSIADVVGVCAALGDLHVDSLSAGEVAVGSGGIEVGHGTMAVPGPAVAELSRGWRVRAGGAGELTTPTGMALLAVLGQACEDLPAMVVERIGTGAGTKDLPGRPNVTRVLVGQPQAAGAPPGGSAAAVLEANVDDLDPRLWPGVLDSLLDAGASDAWLVPILMKKGRPAHTLAVLCDPSGVAALRALIFSLTTTLGVRQTAAEKHALPRNWVEVDVDGAPVEIKIAHDGGVIVQATPEFESVARRAQGLGTSQRDVLTRAVTAAGAAGLTVGSPVPEEVRRKGGSS